MKTTLVCGLLGSGKTTFIRGLVAGSKEKTVVLVNDFASAGMDGEIFSADGIHSIELPSGCVCCTLKFDLIATVQKVIREFSPEHLVIEPSGIAAPSGVLDAMESAGVSPASVVGIVDVTEFSGLYESGMYGGFFEDQIAVSDVILVNKIDLAEENRVKEAEKLIESVNPRAMLFRTMNAELRGGMPLSCVSGDRAGVRGGAPHFHFETLSFKLNCGAGFARFSAFFNALVKGRYGAVVRAKALIQSEDGPYRFDGVFGKVDAVPFERNVRDSRLVVIGEGLDARGIEDAFHFQKDAAYNFE